MSSQCHKYTTDGRKVLVVGKLNNQETIVQEIFVAANGAEIPSGENFVVKSLHDEPVKSWQEMRIAEIEEAFHRLSKQLDEHATCVNKANRLAQEKAKALTAFASNAASDQLKTLEAFVAGEITHIVAGHEYGAPRIREFSAELAGQSDCDRSNIKLLSLFGRTDGNMEWRLHQYSDHSGSATTVIPANGYADAVAIVQGMYDARVEAWRGGKQNNPPDSEWATNVPELVEAEDVLRDRAERAEKSRIDEVAKLKKRLAELEQ